MKRYAVVLCLVLPLVLAFVLKGTFGTSHEVAFGLAVFLSVVSLWISESVPLPVSALMVPALIVAYGVDKASGAFSGFSDPIIFLFLGIFFLARAMEKHGLDRRIAFFIISFFHITSFKMLMLSIGGTAFVLSMFVSNTAVCAMMCPVVIGLMQALSPFFANTEDSTRGTTALLLILAYASSIGGIATPVGTPPNMMALGYFAAHDVHVGFLQWTIISLPISILVFLLAMFLMLLLLPVKGFKGESYAALRSFVNNEKEKLGPISKEEKQVAIVFTSAFILWILPESLELTLGEAAGLVPWLKTHLPLAVVALFAGVCLFFLPSFRTNERNLNWEDAKCIDWGTVVLFGGGLSLGAMLQKTGLSQLAGEMVFGFAAGNEYLLTAAASLVGLFLTEFASNTASAAILLPTLLDMSPRGAALSEYAAVYATTLVISLGFMLPVGTPPNAIVFGTGKVPFRTMIKAGVLLDLLGLLLVYLCVQVLGVLSWIPSFSLAP